MWTSCCSTRPARSPSATARPRRSSLQGCRSRAGGCRSWPRLPMRPQRAVVLSRWRKNNGIRERDIRPWGDACPSRPERMSGVTLNGRQIQRCRGHRDYVRQMDNRFPTEVHATGKHPSRRYAAGVVDGSRVCWRRAAQRYRHAHQGALCGLATWGSRRL
jgi:hypothetical protein